LQATDVLFFFPSLACIIQSMVSENENVVPLFQHRWVAMSCDDFRNFIILMIHMAKHTHSLRACLNRKVKVILRVFQSFYISYFQEKNSQKPSCIQARHWSLKHCKTSSMTIWTLDLRLQNPTLFPPLESLRLYLYPTAFSGTQLAEAKTKRSNPHPLRKPKPNPVQCRKNPWPVWPGFGREDTWSATRSTCRCNERGKSAYNSGARGPRRRRRTPISTRRSPGESGGWRRRK